MRQEAQIPAALTKVAQRLSTAVSTSALLDCLCQVTVEVLGCDHSSILFWQPQEQVYTVTAGYGYTTEHWQRLSAFTLSRADFSSVSGRLEAGETVIERRSGAHPGSAAQALSSALGMTTALFLGLWQGRQLIGCQIVAYQRQRQFTQSQQHLAIGIAQLASLALANAQLSVELERALRVKDDFLATLSHELRTPLNIIMGYIDLSLEGDFDPLTAKQSGALQKVKQAAQQELDLITAMLTVSQLEAGHLRVIKEDIDVAELMQELREKTLQRLDAKPQIGLVWRIPPGLPRLYTDRTKLRVILQHLLSNAVTFTTQGRVTVDVYSRNDGLEFCVADTGMGISPAVRSLLFRRFLQGESSLTHSYGGLGIGLYVVQQMLELVGGAITVDSEEGQGSTFRVWVPQGSTYRDRRERRGVLCGAADQYPRAGPGKAAASPTLEHKAALVIERTCLS